MVFAKISQVAHYAPDQVVSNDDLAEIIVGQVSFGVTFQKMRRQVI